MKRSPSWSARVRADRTLSARTLRVAWALLDRPERTVADLARDLGLTSVRVERAIAALVERGHLRAILAEPIVDGVVCVALAEPVSACRSARVERRVLASCLELAALGLLPARPWSSTDEAARALCALAERFDWSPTPTVRFMADASGQWVAIPTVAKRIAAQVLSQRGAVAMEVA